MNEIELNNALNMIENNDVAYVAFSIQWYAPGNHRYWRFHEALSLQELKRNLIHFIYAEDFISGLSMTICADEERGIFEIFNIFSNMNSSIKELQKLFKRLIDWIDERPELLI